MACFSPLPGYWRVGDDGVRELVWTRKGSDYRCEIPCSKCVGCRLQYTKQMALRCMHESQMHDENSFVTLTYDDAHLPEYSDVSREDHQLFMKRLRKSLGGKRIRFFMAAEYGGQFGRPHFHYLLFGHVFSDMVLNVERFGNKVYESKSLRELWPYGIHTIGDVSYKSASYVARYCIKKLKEEYDYYRDEDTGKRMQVNKKTGEYKVAEFTLMSRGGSQKGARGIGASWYEKFSSDVFPSDQVIVDGHVFKPPKYYDYLLDKSDPDLLESLKLERASKVKWSESTMDRLMVKEEIALSKLKHLLRPLEA